MTTKTTTDNDAGHNAIARQALRSVALAGDIFKSSGYAQELMEDLLRVESPATRENIMACSNLFTNACLKLFCGTAAAPLVSAASSGGKKVYYETFPLVYADFMRFSTSEGVENPLTEEEYVMPKVLYNGGIYRNHVMKKAEDKTLTWNKYKEDKIADLKLRGMVFTREDFLLNAAKCVMSVKAKKEMWRNYGVTRDLLMGLKVYERGTGVARKKRSRGAAAATSEEGSSADEEEEEDNKSKDTTEESDDFEDIEHRPAAKKVAKTSSSKVEDKKPKMAVAESEEEEEEEEEPPKPVAKKPAAKKARGKTKLSASAALALSKVAGDGSFEQNLDENLSDE